MGLADGQTMLNRVMKATFPVVITYSRVVNGVTRSVPVTGWLGNTLFAGLEEQSVSVQWGEIDVLLAAADLVLPTTGLTTPTAGDRLAMTISGTAGVWEVASPDTGEPAWRYSDHGRTRVRVHGKRVS